MVDGDTSLVTAPHGVVEFVFLAILDISLESDEDDGALYDKTGLIVVSLIEADIALEVAPIEADDSNIFAAQKSPLEFNDADDSDLGLGSFVLQLCS